MEIICFFLIFNLELDYFKISFKIRFYNIDIILYIKTKFKKARISCCSDKNKKLLKISKIVSLNRSDNKWRFQDIVKKNLVK